MNCPGVTRAAQLDRRDALDQLGVLDHHHGVGAARHHAAGGDGGRGAGLHLDLGRVAAGDHLGVERELLRRAVGGAGDVGGAQRKAVDIGAVERRHVDRRGEIVRQHAAERGRERHALGGQGREIEMRLEALARLLGGDDFEKLLLARGLRGRRPAARSRRASALRLVAHGHGLTTTRAPARMALAVGRNEDPAFGVGQRLHRQIALRDRLDLAEPPPHRDDLGEAERRGDLARKLGGERLLLDQPEGAARQHAAADGEPARERRVDPARQQQHRPRRRRSRAPWSRPA